MKYIVEVNAKYLVSIEAESLLNAEHKLLAYEGVWGALAFDNKMVKTDTFAGAVQGCEMVSMKDIERMSNEYHKAYENFLGATNMHLKAKKEVERLTAMLEQAKEHERNCERTKANIGWNLEQAENELGTQK